VEGWGDLQVQVEKMGSGFVDEGRVTDSLMTVRDALQFHESKSVIV